MSRLIYLDTNIYMDYFEGRVDNLRPLGEFAFQILRRTFECEFCIAISPIVIDELLHNTKKEKVEELFENLSERNKLVKIKISEMDRYTARKVSKERGTPIYDTIHAIIANRCKAEYLITRNMKDFENLQDFVNIVYPENL